MATVWCLDKELTIGYSIQPQGPGGRKCRTQGPSAFSGVCSFWGWEGTLEGPRGPHWAARPGLWRLEAFMEMLMDAPGTSQGETCSGIYSLNHLLLGVRSLRTSL